MVRSKVVIEFFFSLEKTFSDYRVEKNADFFTRRSVCPVPARGSDAGTPNLSSAYFLDPIGTKSMIVGLAAPMIVGLAIANRTII